MTDACSNAEMIRDAHALVALLTPKTKARMLRIAVELGIWTPSNGTTSLDAMMNNDLQPCSMSPAKDLRESHGETEVAALDRSPSLNPSPTQVPVSGPSPSQGRKRESALRTVMRTLSISEGHICGRTQSWTRSHKRRHDLMKSS